LLSAGDFFSFNIFILPLLGLCFRGRSHNSLHPTHAPRYPHTRIHGVISGRRSVNPHVKSALNCTCWQCCNFLCRSDGPVDARETGMSRTEEVTLKEIECPVCMEYMSPPISLCTRGHNLCDTCSRGIPKCPICQEVFITRNLALEVITNKMKLLYGTPPQPSERRSPYDLLEDYRSKLMIAEEVSRIILKEVKCKSCHKYSLFPIHFCREGHSTCNGCKKCSTCECPVTNGRNFSLETIARCAEYQCKYKCFGCPAILSLCQTEHEEVCEYKPVHCPLFDVAGVRCHWYGVCEDFKIHVTHDHVLCNISESTFISLNIMYTSNTVILALNRMFVLSVLIKNGAVFYRLHLEGPSNDVDRYKCINELLSDGKIISTYVFSPSPRWLEFSGGIFMANSASNLLLNVRIHRV